jgi:CRP-like cAMP-binding protein
MNKGMDRWKALKKKLKLAQQVEDAVSSFIKQPTAAEREISLRHIIEQFQTRRMKDVRPEGEENEENEENEEKAKLNGSKSTTSNTVDANRSNSRISNLMMRKKNKLSTDTYTAQSRRDNNASCFIKLLVPWIDLLMIVGLLGDALLIPILVSFQPPPVGNDEWMYIVQTISEVALILYFIVNAWLSHETKLAKPDELSKIESYRKEWLLYDMIGCVPLNILCGRTLCYQSRSMCSLPIAVNFLKLPMMINRAKRVYYDTLESSSKRKIFTTAFRAVRIVLIILLVLNVLACVWYFIGSGIHNGDMSYNGLGVQKDWFRYLNEETIGHQQYDQVKRSERWLQSLYYSLLILIGDGVVPRTGLQHSFCALCLIIGTIGTAVLIGETANIINKMAAAKSAFEYKMESLDYMMGYLHLPAMLQHRVKEYYEFLWIEHRCLDGDPAPFLNELSPAIKSEVDLFLKRNLILQSELFIDAPPEFVRDVSSQLSIVFYLRGDYVVREKEAGHSMYFISKGTLRVCIQGKYIKDMNEGSCFGEIAILRENSRRSVSARSFVVFSLLVFFSCCSFLFFSHCTLCYIFLGFSRLVQASVYAHTHSTLYTLNRVSIHTLAALHPGVLEKAIALHYSHASPKGKRSALVFGRRASVEQFRRQSDMYGGGGEGQKPEMSLGQSTIEKNYLDIPVDEATTGLPSPAGRNVVALDVQHVHQEEENATATVTKIGRMEKSTSITSNKSYRSPQRRHSTSMLGLEFRLQLILNTLGLESESYQFLLMGCEQANQVQHIKIEKLKNITVQQFHKLQAMCATSDDDGGGGGSGSVNTDTDTEGEEEDGCR